jgi:hypothetical protein
MAQTLRKKKEGKKMVISSKPKIFSVNVSFGHGGNTKMNLTPARNDFFSH